MSVLIKTVQKGKTYYQPKREYVNGRTVVILSEECMKYFVLDVDIKKKKVFASCNGQPPLWHGITKLRYWSETKPVNTGQIVPKRDYKYSKV
jgi:hypothetical protein